ncbi:hypothetical protein D1007_07067 [Hordeum vulgare]|nr:hypothetical protein D1007_07067 [Hordeum vulgare]
MSGGHPVQPIDHGDDWVELEADNSWIPPGVDPALSFRLAVRMETSELRGTKPYAISGFFYPKVVETTISFKDFREALYYRVSQQAVEDEYAEEPSNRARFDDTDDEERKENIDSLVLQEYYGEDMPTIEWNRENPDLTPGTVFESMVDCRNAVTTYCIVTENSYKVDRSEPGRFTVHCPYDR